MRKINPHDFTVAGAGTSREINRQIALNLIRAHQPVSRADLARLMNVRRGVASLLVSELLSESLIFEGAVGESVGRGRRPTFLFIDSRNVVSSASTFRDAKRSSRSRSDGPAARRRQ
jgi:hypothetical protein